MSQRIPKRFKSLEEERRFWLTHDTTDLEDLTPVKITFGKAPRSRTVRLTSVEFHMLQNLLAKLVDAPRLPVHSHHKS